MHLQPGGAIWANAICTLYRDFSGASIEEAVFHTLLYKSGCLRWCHPSFSFLLLTKSCLCAICSIVPYNLRPHPFSRPKRYNKNFFREWCSKMCVNQVWLLPGLTTLSNFAVIIWCKMLHFGSVVFNRRIYSTILTNCYQSGALISFNHRIHVVVISICFTALLWSNGASVSLWCETVLCKQLSKGIRASALQI